MELLKHALCLPRIDALLQNLRLLTNVLQDVLGNILGAGAFIGVARIIITVRELVRRPRAIPVLFLGLQKLVACGVKLLFKNLYARSRLRRLGCSSRIGARLVRYALSPEKKMGCLCFGLFGGSNFLRSFMRNFAASFKLVPLLSFKGLGLFLFRKFNTSAL